MKSAYKRLQNIIVSFCLLVCPLALHAQDYNNQQQPEQNGQPVQNDQSVQYNDQSAQNDQNTQYSDQQVTYQTFYDQLAPYGQWVQDPQYGDVFVPNVEAGFRPYYTDGYWAMTEYGNTWVSSYPWGWACFHYGRWTYDNYYGWIWIPGTEWGPAWVSWRNSEEYYGWAPLGPNFGWAGGFGAYTCPDNWWVFLPPQYLYKHHYYRYWAGTGNNADIIHGTSIVNNVYLNNNHRYISGPRSEQVEAITHQPVKMFHLNANTAPGRSNITNSVVNMYHPMGVRQSAVRPTAPSGNIRAPQEVTHTPEAMQENATPAFHQQMKQNPSVGSEPSQNNNRQNSQRGRYEWDVNRSQPQPVRQPEAQPQYHQPAQQQPRPQQNFNRQPQQSRPVSQPMRSAQPMHSAPAHSGGGGRR